MSITHIHTNEWRVTYMFGTCTMYVRTFKEIGRWIGARKRESVHERGKHRYDGKNSLTARRSALHTIAKVDVICVVVVVAVVLHPKDIE